MHCLICQQPGVARYVVKAEEVTPIKRDGKTIDYNAENRSLGYICSRHSIGPRDAWVEYARGT